MQEASNIARANFIRKYCVTHCVCIYHTFIRVLCVPGSRAMEHACLNCTYMQQLHCTVQYEQCEYCPPIPLVPHLLYLAPHPSSLCHTPLPCATPPLPCTTPLFLVPHPSTLHHTPLPCATPHYLVPHPSTLCHTPLPCATPHYLVPHPSTFVLVVGCWTDNGQCPLDWWLGARNPGDAVLGEEEGQLPVGGSMARRSRKDGKQRRG